MFSRQLIETAEVWCDNGQTAALQYFLLREEDGVCPSYGAEIVLQRGAERESASVRDVTTSQPRGRQLLRLLRRNTVTPCTLWEVLEEALDKV